MANHSLTALQALLSESTERSEAAKRVADWIAGQRQYRWVGLYEVTLTDIGMIAGTGSAPPAFPRFSISKGLCGAAVGAKFIVNSGNVQEDPRWLTTFGTTRSEIMVPVFAKDARLAGLIDVEIDVRNAFGEEEERFLARCASTDAWSC